MEKNIPLEVENLSPGEEENYGIVSKKEIISILKHVAENSSRVAIYCADTNCFVMATVSGVDNTVLWLQSQNDKDNRCIAESDDLIIVGSHLKVKVQFNANKAMPAVYYDHPAFYLPLPDCIYRLQWRQHFRLTLPPSEPLHCLIPVTEPQKGQPRKVAIMDISVGGLKLTFAENETELVEGQAYENCQIKLPGVGTVNLTIIVRGLLSLTTKSNQTIMRAGCQFHKLDGAANILLQRYVNNMQRTIFPSGLVR